MTSLTYGVGGTGTLLLLVGAYMLFTGSGESFNVRRRPPESSDAQLLSA